MDDGNDHDGNGNTTPFDPSTCPVTLGCLLPFVTSRTLFRTPDDNSSGNQHVAFLLEHAMKTWADEAQKSSETLGSAYFARQHHDNFKGKGRNNLALVCMKHPGLGIQSATFVHWQNRGETGRPVELDNLNRVKAVVCVGALREALDLRHASIIHPDVGIPMLRSRGYKMQDRPTMPPEICRLQTMCQHALRKPDDDINIGSESGPVHNFPCVFCSRRMKTLPFPDSLGGVSTARCPGCLQWLCSKNLAIQHYICN